MGKVPSPFPGVRLRARLPGALLFLSLFLLAAASAQQPLVDESRRGYPPHWWMPVLDPHPPAWEILPQAAKSGEVILSKRNELGILSNFAPTPFTLRGKRYASVEGFWQMMLYPEGPGDPRATFPGLHWPFTRDEVAQLSGFEAKAAGDAADANRKLMGIDWGSFEGRRFPLWSKTRGEHFALILEAMRAKLNQNPRVREILLSTGTLTLLPDHVQPSDPPDEWLYHRLWMDLRSELQSRYRSRPGSLRSPDSLPVHFGP